MMPGQVIETVAPLVKYSVTDAEIARLRERYHGLTVDTPQGYEAVRLAIAEIRDLRVAIEQHRVYLKADALVYGRRVDAEAKRITTLLSEIEDPLKLQKDTVDAEKARLKQAVIDAKQRELEAQLRANREAEEARLKVIRDAEEARLAEERARLDAERRSLEEERRVADAREAERQAQERTHREAENARLQQERDALDAERRAVQQARDAAARDEFERQARITAEADAVAKVERDRVAALERQAEIAALLPDVEKVRAFAAAIRSLVPPKVKAKKVAALVTAAVTALAQVAADLELQGGQL